MAEPHVLVVENPEADMLRPWRYSIECPGVTDDCRAWEECHADVWPCNADRYRVDLYEELSRLDWTAHGVEHQWGDDGAWVPTDQCLAVVHPESWDAADDLDLDRPGRYPVELPPLDPSDPGALRLRLVGEVASGA